MNDGEKGGKVDRERLCSGDRLYVVVILGVKDVNQPSYGAGTIP
jgi:hypothetical protein